MTETEPSPELAALLDEFEKRGGVLDFALHDCSPQTANEASHREAGQAFLKRCAMANRKRSEEFDFEAYPQVRVRPYVWDESKLRGRRISFAEFWGTDAIDARRLGASAWGIPNVNGFKSAFFWPPYDLQGGVAGNTALFESLCLHLLGNQPGEELTIWTWSTDCSSYFDDGLEWWGAFLWTISRPLDKTVVLIGASTTD